MSNAFGGERENMKYFLIEKTRRRGLQQKVQNAERGGEGGNGKNKAVKNELFEGKTGVVFRRQIGEHNTGKRADGGKERTDVAPDDRAVNGLQIRLALQGFGDRREKNAHRNIVDEIVGKIGRKPVRKHARLFAEEGADQRRNAVFFKRNDDDEHGEGEGNELVGEPFDRSAEKGEAAFLKDADEEG